MKFSVNERVNIKGKKTTGTIQQTEHKRTVYKNSVKESKRYLVQVGQSWNSQWYDEDMLEGLLEMSKESLEKVNRLLIDINLELGNFDMVKLLSEELRG